MENLIKLKIENVKWRIEGLFFLNWFFKSHFTQPSSTVNRRQYYICRQNLPKKEFELFEYPARGASF